MTRRGPFSCDTRREPANGKTSQTSPQTPRNRLDADGTPSIWAQQVAQLSAWMAGTSDADGQEALTRAELAERIFQRPWKDSGGGDAETGPAMTLGLDGPVGPSAATGPDVAPGR